MLFLAVAVAVPRLFCWILPEQVLQLLGGEELICPAIFTPFGLPKSTERAGNARYGVRARALDEGHEGEATGEWWVVSRHEHYCNAVCDVFGDLKLKEDCFNYDDAKEACVIDGGHLVTITQWWRNEEVRQLTTGECTWIGLAGSGATWYWEDGQVFDYSADFENFGYGADWGEEGAVCMNDYDWQCSEIDGIIAIIFLIGTTLLPTIVTVIILLIFACVYHSKVTKGRPAPYPTQPIHPPAQGLFDVCSDGNTCMYACFCTHIRAGDSHAAMGIGSYWTVIMLGMAASILNSVLNAITSAIIEVQFPYLIQNFLMALYLAPKREQWRKKNNVEGGNMCVDFLAWWCCTPCAAAQEARYVDATQNVHVECCCHLIKKGPVIAQGQVLYGQPVVGTVVNNSEV